MAGYFFNKALVIGASGGIGAAILAELQGNPQCDAVGLSRRYDQLDVTDEQTIKRAAARHRDEEYDLIFNAVGILDPDGAGPEKSFSALSAENMQRVLAVNAVGPALLIKHFAPLLAKGRRSVFASLSARVGSIGDNGLGGWTSYRASKAAHNQILKCAAIEYGRKRPQAVFVSLHPGTIETDLTRRFAKDRYTASPSDAAKQMLAILSSASIEQSGAFIAYDGASIPW